MKKTREEYQIHYSNFEKEESYTSFMSAFKVASTMFGEDDFNMNTLEEEFEHDKLDNENETIVYSAYVFPGVGFYITKTVKDE
jgi:hypothetical protein